VRGFGDLSCALELIARPAAAKERLDAIAEAMAQAQTPIAEANKEQAALVAAEKAHREMLARTSAEHAAALAEAKRNHDEECERRSAALTAREARLSEQESQLVTDQEGAQGAASRFASTGRSIRARYPTDAGRKKIAFRPANYRNSVMMPVAAAMPPAIAAAIVQQRIVR
jgi:hypothetical protein